MKRQLFALLSMVALLTLSSASAATFSGDMVINGGVTPWSGTPTSVDIVNNTGAVSTSNGSYSALSGGSFGNNLDVIDLPLALGDYSSSGLTLFENFISVSLSPAFNVVEHDLKFDLWSIDFVDITSTNILVDLTLNAIGWDSGLSGHQAYFEDDTLVDFRLEFSNNGSSGSYSATTPIPSVATVPSPGTNILMLSGLLGLMYFRNKMAGRTISQGITHFKESLFGTSTHGNYQFAV